MDETIDRPRIDARKFTRIFNSSHSICELGLKHVRDHSSNLGMLFLQSKTAALCGISTKQNEETVRRFIRITGQLGAALFKLGNPNRKDSVYQLEEDPNVIGTESIDESELHEGNWLAAYYWNKIANQESQINWLLDFPTAILTQSSTRGPRLHSAIVNSVKAFEQNSRSFPKTVEKAMELGVSESRVKWVKFEGLPFCRLLAAINDREKNLSEFVRDALAGHKRCSETISAYRDTPEGLIAVGVSALVNIARHRGLVVDVRSDYMPEILSQPH